MKKLVTVKLEEDVAHQLKVRKAMFDDKSYSQTISYLLSHGSC